MLLKLRRKTSAQKTGDEPGIFNTDSNALLHSLSQCPCYTQILTFSTDVVKLLQDVVIVFCPRGRLSLAKDIAVEITSAILSRALSRASSISSRACGRLLVELCTHFTFSVFLNPISEVLHLSSRVKPQNISCIKDNREPGDIAKSTILQFLTVAKNFLAIFPPSVQLYLEPHHWKNRTEYVRNWMKYVDKWDRIH